MARRCICSFITARGHTVVSQWDIHAAQGTHKHIWTTQAQRTAGRPECLESTEPI